MFGNKRSVAAATALSGALVLASGAWAQDDPIVQVDINGEGGPTFDPADAPAWNGWDWVSGVSSVTNDDGAPAGFTNTETFNGIEVTLSGLWGPDAIGAGFANPFVDGRDRLVDSGASADQFRDAVYTDFVFITRNQAVALGHNFFEFDFSGLEPNTPYRFRMYNYDLFANFDPMNTSFMSYSLQNPSDFPNYFPTLNDFVDGQVVSLEPPGESKRPEELELLFRSPMGGPQPSDTENPAFDPGPFDFPYTAEFTITSDDEGEVTFFSWPDGDSFSNTQLAGLINGFEIFEAAVKVSGDADGDGDVDAFDLGIWQTQFGQTGDGLSADFDNDGDVDAFDLGLWQTNFGTGLDGAAVPEPSGAAALLLLAAAGTRSWRRRR